MDGFPPTFSHSGGARDGIGEMLGIGERPQNPDDILADDDEEGTVMRAVMAKLHGAHVRCERRVPILVCGNGRHLVV